MADAISTTAPALSACCAMNGLFVILPPMAKFDLQNYARLGAEARLRQLDEERSAILAAFPDLRTGGAATRRGRRPRVAAAATASTGRRRRRRMSPAQRKAVSERMRKYWASRRAAKK